MRGAVAGPLVEVKCRAGLVSKSRPNLRLHPKVRSRANLTKRPKTCPRSKCGPDIQLLFLLFRVQGCRNARRDDLREPPGCVTTSTDPQCCLTIMVRLIDRPTHGSRSVESGSRGQPPRSRGGDTGVPGLGFGHRELRRFNQGNSSIRHSVAMRCTRRHSPTKMPFDAMSAFL